MQLTSSPRITGGVGTGGGTVVDVTASLPLTSTGGITPNIAINQPSTGQIWYTNAIGILTGDAFNTRNSVTQETSILTNFTASTLGGMVIMSNLLGSGAPGIGNFYQDTNVNTFAFNIAGDLTNFGVNGIGTLNAFSNVAGVASQAIMNVDAAGIVHENSGLNIHGSCAVQDTETHMGFNTGGIDNRFVLDASGINYKYATNSKFSVSNSGVATFNNAYSIPGVDGTNGQALITNGAGTVSFQNITASAAGLDTQVQYNDHGLLAGNPLFTFAYATGGFFVGSGSAPGDVFISQLNPGGTTISNNRVDIFSDDTTIGDVGLTSNKGFISIDVLSNNIQLSAPKFGTAATARVSIGDPAGIGNKTTSVVDDNLQLITQSSGGSNRNVIAGKPKVIPNNTVTSIFEVALPAGTMTGGSFSVNITATDGTDFQTHSDRVTYAAVNKGGVYTTAINQSNSGDSVATSSGTLAVTWSIVTGTNKVTISVNANSSLTSPTDTLYINVDNNSGQVITIL